MFHSNYDNVDVIIAIPTFSESIITQLCGRLEPIVSTIFQDYNPLCRSVEPVADVSGRLKISWSPDPLRYVKKMAARVPK